jgi:hypothetical protein
MTYSTKVTPLSERQALIKKGLATSTKHGETIYDFKGDRYVPPVVSLRIDVPVYRMENCRTFSEQQNEIALKGFPKDFFEKGQEQNSVQSAQHAILASLAKKGTTSVSPIVDVLDKDGQREPILVTSTGVVVNGNRRLAAMRELFRREDGSIDKRFEYVECAVLPEDTSADEIDDIEASLQARPQTKLDYDWIGDAQLIRRQVNKNRTTREVADQLRRSKPEIENLLQAIDEADLYLSKWLEKPGQYALISSDAEQIFGDLPKRLNGKSAALQDASRLIAWNLLENRDKLAGRLYGYNAAFGKLAPKVLELVAEQLDVNLKGSPRVEEGDDADFSFEVDGGDVENYAPLFSIFKSDGKEQAIDALIEACESAIEGEKGRASAGAALKTVSLAHSKLAGVDVSTAGAPTLSPILKQIESIRSVLLKIEERIALRLSEGSSE